MILQAVNRATLMVRDMVCEVFIIPSLQDEEGNLLDLPSHISKHGLFNALVAERGWYYKYDNRSNPLTKKKVPSWTTFRVHWKSQYPNLVIAGAGGDICNKRVVYAYQHKYARMEQSLMEEDDDDPNVGPEEDAIEDNTMEQDMLDGERLVLAAAKHVEMAQKQQLLYQA